MSAIDLLTIPEPDSEPTRKRARTDDLKPHEIVVEEPKSKPNVWYHPISRVAFDFAANDDKPEIHVKGHGPVPLTIVGHMGGNSLLQDPNARFVTTTASVRIYVDEDTLKRLRAMTKKAAEWIVANKSDLDKDWKRVLKNKTAKDIESFWDKELDNGRNYVNAKRGYHLAFSIYKLTSKSPLNYEFVAGKGKNDKDGPVGAWDGDKYIRHESKVMLRIKPNFVQYQNRVGVNIRFQEQILILEDPVQTDIPKVDFSTI